ncbi:MAG: matrixin family metalloprotease, partial [Armatimonadota bacterium]|nr:matrixin family metalloprotease [Armatimonadota bacterium]
GEPEFIAPKIGGWGPAMNSGSNMADLRPPIIDSSGSKGWSVNLGSPAETLSGVIVAGSVVITASAGRVYGFAVGGDGAGRHRLVWQYSPPADAEYTATHPWIEPEISAQAISGGDLYVLARTGVLTCLSADATDTAGPTVDLRYPEGGRYAPQDIAGIVARVQDRESGYLTGSLKLMVDGLPIASGYMFEPGTGRLTYTPPQAFSAGVHTVRVLASDNRNNTSDTDWSFVVDPAAQSAAGGNAIAALRPVSGSTSPSDMEGLGSSLPRGIVPPGGTYFVPNYVRELKSLTRWAHFPLEVFFVRDGEYSIERQRATTAGFSRWVEATGSVISYRVVNDPAAANVTVRFDPTKCDGITYTESVGLQIDKADINLGIALPGDNAQRMPLLDLACVAAHEFGHTLGLNGHSSDPADVMFFQHTVGQPWILTRRDLNTLRIDYAPLFGAASSPAGHLPGM